MYVFSSRWDTEAVNEAIQHGDETFSKVEFLIAFNSFRSKAFKDTTIRLAWKKTGLLPFNPALVADKVRDGLTPTRNTTPPPEWIPLDKTPTWDFCGVAPRMVVQKPIKLTDDVSEGFMHESKDLNFNEAESFTGLGNRNTRLFGTNKI